MNKKKKRTPHRLDIPQPKKDIQVEVILPQARYLGRLAADPVGNIGDNYFNTGSGKMKFRTESVWENAD